MDKTCSTSKQNSHTMESISPSPFLLVVRNSNSTQWKEAFLAGCIVAVGSAITYVIPYGNYYELSLKIIFGVCVLWVAIMNITEDERCEINKKRGTIKLYRANLVKKKVFILPLVDLLSCTIEEKGNKYQLVS